MKTIRIITQWLAQAALLATLNLQPSTAFAAVTCTITPNTVSNTYNGQITMSISNVTAGSTVVVQKFLDVNTNGIIDGKDWLVQQFSMTDGQPGMVINNVTNINVPGDTDGAANGTIVARLNFQGGDLAQNFVGRYRVKVSGSFSPPLTNVFTVTNFPWPQKFTGVVYSNGVAASNAVVVVMSAAEGNGVAGAVANISGNYSLQVPPGNYLLVPFRTNCVANTSAAVVNLAPGSTVTTNLFLTNTTASISGKVVDSADSSIGLPGVLVPVQSQTGLMGVAFTDTNGNFTAGVRSGQWGVKADDTSLIVHGYLGLQNETNVNAGVTGVTIVVPKATALIYGTVKNNLGNPFAALDVYANDQNNGLYQTDAYTDTNGNYVLGVLGLGGNDPWWMQANGDSQLTNYVFSQEQVPNNGAITSGTAVPQNFIGILATNTVTGNFKTSGGTNIVGLSVSGNVSINGTNYQTAYTVTDHNGNYAFNVCNGSWSIGANCQGGSDSLDGILGGGTYVCPDNQTATIAGINATNNFTVELCGGIAIVTASPLPVGEVNVPFDQSIQASDCSGTYNWSQSGGTLPGGLNLFANGQSYVLSGTPTSSGIFNFTVQVDDGDGNATNQQFSVSISNALQITTGSLPNGTNGAAYSQQLQAANGVPFAGPPYSWSLSSGALPANLNLSAGGLLSGPVATTGAFNFTVQAADSLGGLYDQPLSLTIVATNSPSLAIGSAGGQMLVFWPLSAGTNFTVQMTTNLATGPWVPVTNGVPQIGLTITNTGTAAFFRLQ